MARPSTPFGWKCAMDVKLVIAGGRHAGMEIPVTEPKFLIGRKDDCQLRPLSKLVSRKHCAISVEAESVAIEDCGSTNGTFVNGEQIQGRCELADGDRIKVGALELEIRLTPKAAEVKKPKGVGVAAATVGENDLDLSSWLEEDNLDVDPPADKRDITTHDTTTDAKLAETAAMPAASGSQKKKSQPPAKTGSKAQRIKTPPATNSQAAAGDALKHLFNRPKSKP